MPSNPIRGKKCPKIRGNLGRGDGHHLHQWQVEASEKVLPKLVAQKGRPRTTKEGGWPS